MSQGTSNAQKLRSIRALFGITQEELGLLLDLHPQTISKIERGLPVCLGSRNANILQSFARAKLPENGVSSLIRERGATNAMVILVASANAEE